MSAVAGQIWAEVALARIRDATGHSYRLVEHRPPPHPNRLQSGVWVVADGDRRACLKRLPGIADLARQQATAATCERLYAAGSPVPRYHLVDVVAGDVIALMDFIGGHPVLLGGLTPSQAGHLLELIALQADAAVLPPGPPDTEAIKILGWAEERAGTYSGEAAQLLRRIQAAALDLTGVRLPSGDIVHGDMNPSNFIVDREGGDRVVGIVDWETTTTGDHAADVATILHYQWDPAVHQVLWEGLQALCTTEALRLRVVGLAFWSLDSGHPERAAQLLARIQA